MNEDLIFIDDNTALQTLCADLAGCQWLAVDTEFERVNTYYPEWCLLQLANADVIAVVDPLAINDLEPLYGLLYAPSITKVFHAARQDLELFYHIKRKLPAPLFDTQIAAALLGYDAQIGYANLVQEVLGVELGKTQARTDWKRRPLHRNQLRYAADDVIYLAKMYQILRPRLLESAQIAVLEEAVRALQNSELYEPDPQSMWKKIKESRRMEGDSLLLLQRLAAWRELTARTENRPRKWVLPDHTLVAIARLQPASQDELLKIDGMNERALKRYANALLQMVSQVTPV